MSIPPDYWPDATRIPGTQFRDFVELVRRCRGRSGLSNQALGQAVRALVQAHNTDPERQRIDLRPATADRDIGALTTYELDAIVKGTRRYIPGFLAWLWQHHEDAVKAFYDEIALAYPLVEATDGDRPRPQITSWPQLIRAYARFERLEVIPAPGESLDLVGLARLEPVHDRPIRRGEPFLLRFDTPMRGGALALQRHEGAWYPLPLSDGPLYQRIEPGPQLLPRRADGAPDPLSEPTSSEPLGFAILFGPEHLVRELARPMVEAQPLSIALLPAAERLLAGLPRPMRFIPRINVSIAK